MRVYASQRSPIRNHASPISLCAALGAVALIACGGCAMPLMQRAEPLPTTGTDGLNIATVAAPPRARDAAMRALQANGFTIDARNSSASMIRTAARSIAADSSIVVTALITPVDLAPTQSMITLSATLSVPTVGIRNAQLRWTPASHEGPERFLFLVRDSLRQLAAPAP